MRAGGLGFLLFARTQPDTPGKLAAHAYSFEHLEIAAYELLARARGVAQCVQPCRCVTRVGGNTMHPTRRGLFPTPRPAM